MRSVISIITSFSSNPPGDSGCELIGLSNTGSLDGKAWLHIVGVADDENGLTEPEVELGDTDEKGELCDNLYIVIWVDEDGDCELDEGEVIVAEGYRSEIECIEWDIGTIEAEGSVSICFSWEIDEEVGNIIQSDYCEFEIVFGLEQA
jgi:hypothetical protein